MFYYLIAEASDSIQAIYDTVDEATQDANRRQRK